jgi:hydroxyquinol 1,2-dioxygenase
MQLVTEDNITGLAAERWGTARDPRTAELLTALVRHLHDFAREVRLTEAEWMAAIQWLTRTGRSATTSARSSSSPPTSSGCRCSSSR